MGKTLGEVLKEQFAKPPATHPASVSIWLDGFGKGVAEAVKKPTPRPLGLPDPKATAANAAMLQSISALLFLRFLIDSMKVLKINVYTMPPGRSYAQVLDSIRELQRNAEWLQRTLSDAIKVDGADGILKTVLKQEAVKAALAISAFEGLDLSDSYPKFDEFLQNATVERVIGFFESDLTFRLLDLARSRLRLAKSFDLRRALQSLEQLLARYENKLAARVDVVKELERGGNRRAVLTYYVELWKRIYREPLT